MLAVLTCVAAPGALAQSQSYYSRDPNVTIDMSVLGGGGPAYPAPAYPSQSYGNAPAGGSAWYGQAPAYGAQTFGLQFPPSSVPRSRLTGPLSGQDLRLTPPSRAAAPAPQPASPSTASAPDSPPRQPAETQPSSPPPAATPPAASSETTPRAAPPAPAAPAPTRTPPAPSVAPPPTPSTAEAAPAPAAPAPAESAPSDSMDTQTAARSPSTAGASSGLDHTGPGGMTRITFETGSAKVPASADPLLDELASELNANDALRVQLMAYADGDNDAANPARRLSLSRALAVRTALIEKGVRSTRMDVRALGNKYADGPADRVDAVLVER